jgi:hypothetical protein
MKQTAVEWLVEQIKYNVHNTIEEFELTVEQAKEMEKQQIEQAFNEGDLFSHNYDESGEKYYIYTFEK